MSNINKKEFLTFSNSTNLDWQFAKLEKDKNDKYPQIIEKLKPESFVRKDEENPDVVKYIYSDIELQEGQSLTPEQIEKGLDEMRKNAPVIMNYLEECDKGSKEGDFLKDWEVIYGADNYKVAEDYVEMSIKEAAEFQKKIREMLNNNLVKGFLDNYRDLTSNGGFEKYVRETYKAAILLTIAEETPELLPDDYDIEILLAEEEEEYIKSLAEVIEKDAGMQNEISQGLVEGMDITRLEKVLEDEEEKTKEIKNILIGRDKVESKHRLTENLNMTLGTVSKGLKLLSYTYGFSTFSQKNSKRNRTSNELISKKNDSIKDVKKTLVKKVDNIKSSRDPEYKKKLKTRQKDLFIGNRKNPTAKVKKIKGGEKVLPISKEHESRFYRLTEKNAKILKVSMIRKEERNYSKTLEGVIKKFDDELIRIQYEFDEDNFDSCLNKFMELLIGSMVSANTDKLIKNQNEIMSPILNVVSALFTRADGVDYINTCINEFGGKAIAQINKELYLTPQRLLGSNIELSKELALYDTGFRVTAFKKEDKIVIAYKGDEKSKERKELLPEGLDRLEIVYKKIKGDNPNIKEILFTGYENGAELGFIQSIQGKEGVCGGTFFTNQIESLNGIVNFTIEDMNKEYRSDLNFHVYKAGKDMGVELGVMGSAYMLSLFLKGTLPALSLNSFPLWKMTGEVILSSVGKVMGSIKGVKKLVQVLKVTGPLKVALVYVAVKAFELSVNYYLKKQEKKELTALYKSLQSEEYNIIRECEGGVKGYIMEREFIEVDSTYFSGTSVAKEKVRVDIASILFLTDNFKEEINLLPDFSIIKLGTNYRKVEDEVEYFVESSYKNLKFLYRLIKNSEEVYEVVGISDIYDLNPLFSPMKSLNKEEVEKLNKAKTLLNLLEVISQMQNSYLNNKENINFVYVTEDSVKTSSGFPEDAVVEDYKERYRYSELNEAIFLPFIGKDGEIQGEIREEYVKNLFKDGIRFVSNKKPQKLAYGDIDEALVNIFKEYKDSVEARIGTIDEVEGEKMAYFYDAVMDKIEKKTIDCSKLYEFQRTGYDTGILKFGEIENEMKYGYNSATPLTRDGFELEVEELKSYDGNSLKGSVDRLIKLFNDENVDDKDSDYNFVHKDTNKVKSRSTGLEKLSLEGKELGTNIVHISKVKNQENSEGTEEEVVEKPWFESGAIEEYYEDIELSSEELLKVRYIYERSTNELKIRYSKGSYLDTEIKVEEFKNGDFSVKLPRYHKLTGSAGGLGRSANVNSFSKDMKEVLSIEDSVASKIVVDSHQLGKSLVKDGKVEDQDKTIFRFSKGDSEVYYYYHEDKRLEIAYGSLTNEVPRFSNLIEIGDFKNKDFGLYLPFGIAFIDFIEEEGENKGKQIDNVTKTALLNYYDDNGNNTNKTLLYDYSILIMDQENLSVFILSKELIPTPNTLAGLSNNLKDEFTSTWGDYKGALEKAIETDLNNYRKENYIGDNTISPPGDSEIDKLLGAYIKGSEIHKFFKSFQSQTQQERDEERAEETRVAQEEILNSASKSKEQKVVIIERPSLRYEGKNGSLGKWF